MRLTCIICWIHGSKQSEVGVPRNSHGIAPFRQHNAALRILQQPGNPLQSLHSCNFLGQVPFKAKSEESRQAEHETLGDPKQQVKMKPA